MVGVAQAYLTCVKALVFAEIGQFFVQVSGKQFWRLTWPESNIGLMAVVWFARGGIVVDFNNFVGGANDRGVTRDPGRYDSSKMQMIREESENLRLR
jgi:hypothetical protein